MKTNHIIKSRLVILTITLILFFLQSCESMIEVSPPDNQINKENIFKDISTTKSALTHLYIKVRDTPMLNKSNTGSSYSLDLYTDQLEFIGLSQNNFYLNSIEASSNETAQWWNTSYMDIYAINAFIIGLSESTYITDKDKKQFLGEAYALRALYYQNLALLFGDIPYTISTDYKYNTTITKTPYSKVLELIEKDLLLAYNNLDNSFRSSERFYINKPVVELLLSYNYLLQKKYDQAEFYSSAVIENNNYKLEDNINKVFKKTATSTLWQLSPDLLTSSTPEANVYQIKTITANTVTASKELINLFAKEDLRYLNWFEKVTINNNLLHQIYKYKNTVNNTDELSIYYRLEEAYFNLSLALALQNKIDRAVDILNVIRQKRGIAPINQTVDQSTFIKEYLNESAREFFTEKGRRFFDLKLTDNLGELIKVKPNWKTHHNLFPIPEKQIQINKNLLPNNIGY
ncbi:RagB/SusD family nutrient uptake outer membrane protein [Myroides pelagicus]|uniref:RagB/SusD family nutrient uptake outer membrane protein n=1 Tax=Myroides pelagicus TaxID=270914 RepID=UPI002DBD4EC7|nr:RagB/SusD family nutrient uptake outer membrane protein [Myroides pelagicus]MEC4115144.1 RagB/SusD family nutrient uptake outer membrane protein [Myroides pelagicus]